jgi:hypothetical protein
VLFFKFQKAVETPSFRLKNPSLQPFGIAAFPPRVAGRLILCLAFLPLCLSSGCQRKQAPIPEAVAEPTPAEILADLRIREPATGLKRDTVMLEFLLGMNRRQMTAHTMKLAREGNMYKVPKGANRSEYVYDLNLDGFGRVRTYFEAKFYRDSLYWLECLPTVPKAGNAAAMYKETAALYTRKYGDPSVVLPGDSAFPSGAHYWIRGNREIELFADDRNLVVIHYVDLIRQRKAEKDLDI